MRYSAVSDSVMTTNTQLLPSVTPIHCHTLCPFSCVLLIGYNDVRVPENLETKHGHYKITQNRSVLVLTQPSYCDDAVTETCVKRTALISTFTQLNRYVSRADKSRHTLPCSVCRFGSKLPVEQKRVPVLTPDTDRVTYSAQ